MIPSDIIDLAQWLKASSLSLSDGDPIVAPIHDSSGNGRTAAPLDGSVIYRANVGGHPALYFDGSSSLSFASFMGAWTAGEFWLVFKVDADPESSEGLTAFPLGNTGTDPFSDHHPWTNGIDYNGLGSNARKTVGNPIRPQTQFHLVNITTKAGEWTFRINNEVVFTTASNTVAFSGGTIYIGKDTRLPCFFKGYLYEIFSIPRAATTLERDGMWAYVQSVDGVVDALVPGYVAGTDFTATTAKLWTAAALPGVGSIRYQWYRKTTGSYAAVGGATSRVLNDTGLTTGTKYTYKCVYSDDAASVDSNEQEIIPNTPTVRYMTPGWITTLQDLWTAQHPWIVYVKDQYDLLWGTYGADNWVNMLLPTVTWFATGDTFYRDHAINHLNLVDQAPLGLNDSAQIWWEVPLTYSWMKGYMTDDQQGEICYKINNGSRFMLGRNSAPGTRPGDNDVDWGHYHFLFSSDTFLGTDYLNQTSDAYPSFNPTPDWRDHLTDVLDFADNGEWVESSAYNLETNQYSTIMYGIKPSAFSDYAEWLPKLATQLRWHLTENYLDSVRWGDVQEDSLLLQDRFCLMCLVIAQGGDIDGELLKTVARLTEVHPFSYYRFLMSRILLCFDPRTLPSPANANSPTGLRNSTHLGLSIYRQPRHLVQGLFAHGGIDDHAPKNFRDIMVWIDNERVIGHPIYYQSANNLFNTGNVYNLYALFGPNLRTLDLIEETADGFLMEGSFGPSTYQYGIDPTHPTVTYTGRQRYYKTGAAQGTLVVRDTFEYDQLPPTLGDGWTQDFLDDFVTEPGASLQIWHSPVDPTPTGSGYTWTTLNGQTVNLITDAPSKTTRHFTMPDTSEWWSIYFYDAASLSVSITTQALINGATVPNTPTAGTLTLTSNTTSQVTLALATNTGGTGPYSNQLQRSLHGAGSWSNIGSPVSGATASLSDTTVTAGGDYDYRVLVTDSLGATDFSNVLEVQVASGVRYLPPAYLLLLLPPQEIGLAFAGNVILPPVHMFASSLTYEPRIGMSIAF